MPRIKSRSFAESQGKTPLNWYKFLLKGPFSAVSLKEADKLADSWITCACGNQCEIIPRMDSILYMPEDKLLANLGIVFSRNIEELGKVFRDLEFYEEDEDYYCFRTMDARINFTISQLHALHTLDQIEIRSKEIIQEILKSQPK